MPLNLPGLLDLSPVFAVFAALAGSAYSASNILQWLRNLGLDGLIARLHLNDRQRTEVLQTLLVVISFGMLLGLSLMLHFMFSPNLLMSVFLGALGSAGGAHFSYQHTQKPTPEPNYPEIPGLPDNSASAPAPQQ